MENRTIADTILHAGSLEADNPKAAMREYILAQKLNTNQYPILSTIGFFLPVLATVITYYVVKTLGEEAFCLRILISIMIQLFVGYFPIFYLRHNTLTKTRFRYQKQQDPNPVRTSASVALMVMANEFLAVLGVIFFGFMISFPALWLVAKIVGLTLSDFMQWPRLFYYFGLGLILLMGCSFYLTNMPISLYFFPPVDYLSMREPGAKLRWWKRSMKSLMLQVPAGWIKNWGLIKQTLASFLFTYIIGRINLDVANFSLLEAVLTGALAGFLLSGEADKAEDDPLIDGLAILGRVRCLMRLARFPAAIEWIWEIGRYTFFPQPLRSLAATLEQFITCLQPGWPDEFRECASRRAQGWFMELEKEAWDRPYLSLWNASLKNTRALISSSLNQR